MAALRDALAWLLEDYNPDPVGEPAPMPPEMPEIQAGDLIGCVVLQRVSNVRPDGSANCWSGHLAQRKDIVLVEGERNGKHIVWRRADRKEP